MRSRNAMAFVVNRTWTRAVDAIGRERCASAHLEGCSVEAGADRPAQEPLVVVAADSDGSSLDEQLEDLARFRAMVAEVADDDDGYVAEASEESAQLPRRP